ncbi:MAG: hypothetical protein F6K10_29520 [Moorea sp. SIO2B7]|nr:hypothetical protein [Moorena sp. SIO2B7]
MLLIIPDLKLSDQGLLSGKEFNFLPLFIESLDVDEPQSLGYKLKVLPKGIKALSSQP